MHGDLADTYWALGSLESLLLKLFTTDCDLHPCTGTRTQSKPSLGLEPTWLGLSSVQFSRSVMSDSLQPHEPQHPRPLCPSPTPRVHPNPFPLSW